jgi:hypothetical protein
VSDDNTGEFDYLPAREHDVRAFGKLLDSEDYAQYEADTANKEAS